MKRIVLKPEIKEGDKFYFNEELVIELLDTLKKFDYINSGICPLCKNKLNVNTADEGTSSWGNCPNCSFDPNKITDNELREMKKQVAEQSNKYEERYMNIDCADAIKKLKYEMECDIDYAWCWHSNIVTMMNTCEIHPIKAHKVAACIMSHLFNIDTTKHKSYPREQVADAGKAFNCSNNPECDGLCCQKTEEKPPLKLRVGGVYRNRGGKIVTLIKEDKGDTQYPFKDNDGYWYRPNGKYINQDDANNMELIEEVQTKQEKEAVWYCECIGYRSYFVSSPNICSECEKPFPKVKPESNPFKVGDKVIGYDLDYDDEGIRHGVIREVDGNFVDIKRDDWPEQDEEDKFWLHYKQCEKVDE